MNRSELPIGVFDSGLGGLTVLKTLRERFPHEHFVYLGDTARIPYGTKSARTITKYLEQNVNFLTQVRMPDLNSIGVKAIVIACNSASSVAHNIKCPVPIYDVITPGSQAACAATQNNHIGILATRATVASKSYVTKIKSINSNAHVFQQAAPLLVPLVEEGWDDDPITNLIIYRYISPLLNSGVDTLVLGCTHYPILKNAIKRVAGNNVTLIESGQSVGSQIETHFQNGQLLPNHSGLTGKIYYLTTDVSENFHAQAMRIMQPHKVDKLELVDI